MRGSLRPWMAGGMGIDGGGTPKAARRNPGSGRGTHGPMDAAAGGPYSYCNAASTFSRAARRAGAIAAIMPAMTAAITNTISVPIGIVKAA